MPTKPHLSPRAITTYNRLAKDVAALNYLTRIAKPAGLLGEEGRIILARTLRTANRLYRREAEMPFFSNINPAVPVAQADLVLLVARLSAASTAFEERYAHLKEGGRKETPVWRDADGLPSPHA